MLMGCFQKTGLSPIQERFFGHHAAFCLTGKTLHAIRDLAVSPAACAQSCPHLAGITHRPRCRQKLEQRRILHANQVLATHPDTLHTMLSTFRVQNPSRRPVLDIIRLVDAGVSPVWPLFLPTIHPSRIFCAGEEFCIESRTLPAGKDIPHNLIHRICGEVGQDF